MARGNPDPYLVLGVPPASTQTEITHDGKYLFAINTGNSTISSYSIGHGEQRLTASPVS